MKSIDRYVEFREDDLDYILLKIKNGDIKAGKYSDLIKIDKNVKMKKGWFFEDEHKSE